MTFEERLLCLIFGNIGDKVAIKNICEVHDVDMEKIDENEKEFFLHTNQLL